MFDPLRVDVFPKQGAFLIQVCAWRGDGISVFHGDVAIQAEQQEVQNHAYRYYAQWFETFVAQAGDRVTLVAGDLRSVIEVQLRPVTLTNALDAEIYFNGLLLADIVREESES